MTGCSDHQGGWILLRHRLGALDRCRALTVAAAALALLCLAMPAPAVAQQTPEPVRTVVTSGDSWLSLRSRLCPVEALQQANPDLAGRALQPGDLVQSAFVPLPLLVEAGAANRDLQEELVELRKETQIELEQIARQRSQLDTRASSLAQRESLISDLEAENASSGILIQILGALCTLLALGAAAAAFWSWRATHERSALHENLQQVEARYWDLHRGLAEIDLEVQRRMLRLLRSQGARVLTKEQVDDATAPVIELATRIQQRHSG